MVVELVGDRGSIISEGNEIVLKTSSESVTEHRRTTREMFGMPEFVTETLSDFPAVDQHAAVLENFVAAIDGRQPLLTAGAEGLGSLQLANAMLLSDWTGEAVTLPLDAAAYEQRLAERVAASAMRTPEDIDVEIDMDASYR